MPVPSLPSLTRVFDERALEGIMLRLLEEAVGSAPRLLPALVIAAAVGAVHALGPGHGKVLVGAYLASSRGRTRDAVALGGLVATMHTVTVLLLGVGFASLHRVPGGDRLDAGLRLVSGVAVTAVGAWLLQRHLQAGGTRSVSPAPGVHPRVAHVHDARAQDARGQGHDPGPGQHLHDLPAEVRPLSRAGVLALATSGGLVPSPAAFVMLASAIAVGRPGFGLALVVGFSAGLALTLTGVGVSIVSSRGHLERWSARLPGMTRVTRTLPLAAALVVLAGGLVLSVGAMRTL